MSEAIESIRYDRDFLSLPQQTHVCLIYSSEHNRRTSISQYVNSALSKYDRFLYVTDATTESVLEWLHCPYASEQDDSGQFMIDIAEQIYCSCGGRFVPKEMLSRLEEFNQFSLKKGYRGFSGTGEMSWATRGWPGSEYLIDYEAQLNDLVMEHFLTMLCQYDVNRFDGGIILDVLRVHPKVFINGQVSENPFYKRAPINKRTRKATLEPNSGVLAELMLVQGLLYVFPTERKLGEFVSKALERIPGCVACVVQFYENGRLISAQKPAISPVYTDSVTSSDDLYERVTFPLTTYKRHYGYLILTVQDRSLFKPYEPHVQTVVNSIAITFENRWQQCELSSEIERHKDTAAELINANDELMRFNYTVSHDLKSPLITMGGFLGFLERDIEHGDKAKIRADLDQIRLANSTMQDLLEGLLKFSKIGRVADNPIVISLTETIEIVRNNLASILNNKNIMIEISEDLPNVMYDRLRLVEVFQNLIENAAKFMGKQENPTIQISGRCTNGAFLCHVKDNGVGIEKNYQVKIFDLFEVLEKKQGGSGIGLALVQRIVEHHGGRIWVESDGPGYGSTFSFTLPMA